MVKLFNSLYGHLPVSEQIDLIIFGYVCVGLLLLISTAILALVLLYEVN